MNPVSKIEVAALKSGELVTNWNTLGEIWSNDNQLIELAARFKKKKNKLKEYSLNIIFANIDCDTIAIRRILSNANNEALWTVKCPKTTLATVKDIDFNPLARKSLTIVYFINCRVSQYWETIFVHHLKDLSASGICNYPQCRIKIVANCNPSELAKVAEIADLYLSFKAIKNSKNDKSIGCCYEIIRTQEDFYEYPGIKLVHEVAKLSNKGDYIVYAHAKGLSHLKSESTTCPSHSSIASQMILKNAMINVDILEAIPSLNKIGPGLGGNGWMWFNFYLSRSSYIKKLHKPVMTNNRHYYESWLGNFPDDASETKNLPTVQLDDGLSLACMPFPSISSSFTPHEMCEHVDQHFSEITNTLNQSYEKLF